MKANKSWFYRLLLSYLPIFFIVSLVIVLLSFIFIVQISQRQAKSANELFARTVMTSIDQSLQSIDYTLMQDIETDETISKFFKDNLNSYFLNYRVAQKLEGWMNAHPLIDSAYVVRWADGLVITNSGLTSITDFADRSFVIQEKNKRLPLYWTHNRTVALNADEDTKTVISLARRVPLLVGNQGMVIVNIKTHSIEHFIRDSVALKFGFITIKGSDGQRILGTDTPSDYKASSIMTIAISSYTGWEFLSGVKDYRIFSYTSLLSYVWLAVGLIVTVLGVVWIVYVTRRNYKPIENLFVQLSVFQKNLERDRRIKGKQLIHEVMNGGFAGDVKDLFEEMSELRLIIKGELPVQFLVSIAEIDRFYSFSTRYSASDQHLLRYVLAKIIQEISENDLFNIWCEWISNSRMTILFLFDHEQDPEQLAEKVNRFWSEVIGWMERNLEYTITIGNGTLARQMDDIQRSYQDAEEILRYKWILEKRPVIWKNDIGVKSAKKVFEYQHLIDSIAYSFRMGNPDWKSLFVQFFTEVKRGILTHDDMVSLLNYLLFTLDRELSYLDIGSMESVKENSLSYIREEIHKLEDVTDFQSYLNTMLTELSENIQQLRESQNNHRTVYEVKTFIEQNFQNPELSLVSVSERFHMSGSYLSRLFKEEFGENFVNYLMKQRIKHAKQLLVETSLPIQQIANSVGYTHSVSFNRVFKKMVGRTPGEYRNQAG